MQIIEKATAIAIGLLLLAARVFAQEDVLPSVPQGAGWKLAWHDEFDGTALDETKWEAREGPRKKGFWIPEDVSLEDGKLVLHIRRDGDRLTCGGLWSRNRHEHRYGYYVARCRLPREKGKGYHAAFWLHAASVSTIGNEGRDGTEIDIMESFHPDEVNHALHWDGYKEHHQELFEKRPIEGIGAGWHTFALHWSPDEYVFYIDGKESLRTSAGGVSQVPEFLQLTVEFNRFHFHRIDEVEFPDRFEVDYVRIYDLVSSRTGEPTYRALPLESVEK